jgi:hypothetical protein
MYRLQVIHIHDRTVVATVEGNDEALVKAAADRGCEIADAEAGTLAHYVGLLHTDVRSTTVTGKETSFARHTGQHAKGICRKCRGLYPINKDGRLAKHGGAYGIRKALKKYCKGSGLLPLTLAGK